MHYSRRYHGVPVHHRRIAASTSFCPAVPLFPMRATSVRAWDLSSSGPTLCSKPEDPAFSRRNREVGIGRFLCPAGRIKQPKSSGSSLSLRNRVNAHPPFPKGSDRDDHRRVRRNVKVVRESCNPNMLGNIRRPRLFQSL
jgi:hypothetical protein